MADGRVVQGRYECGLSRLNVREKSKMSETGMNWYVLRAVSGKEHKVKEFIEAAKKHNDVLNACVGEILLPTEKYAMMRNGKRVIKEKLFLPGYILIQAQLQGEVAHMLRFIPNVLGFLGGMDNPEVVRLADINRILGTAEESSIENTDVAIPYNVDDTVKVTDGPFSGFNGVVEEVNTDKRKLKVMVKIFGRKTPLELAFTQVEKE